MEDSCPERTGGLREEREQFALLMERVRAGSRDAAAQLLEEYGSHIRRVVRRKLSRRLRSRFDSLDFVQDVWASFFAVPEGQQQFEEPEALIAFLVTVAKNKVIEAVRRGFMTRRNLNQERSLDGSAAIQAQGVAARQPTPSQLAAAKERWDQLVESASDQQEQMLHLLQEGKTHEEIASRLGVNERTIRRTLAKLDPRRQVS